jgi:hypothetical protein
MKDATPPTGEEPAEALRVMTSLDLVKLMSGSRLELRNDLCLTVKRFDHSSDRNLRLLYIDAHDYFRIGKKRAYPKRWENGSILLPSGAAEGQ